MTGDIQTLSPGVAQGTGSINSSQVKGTATNDNAAAGVVGEFVTATVAVGSAVPLTSTVTSNVTSISLTAGDWDIAAVVDHNIAATTSVTNLTAAISLTTGTLPTQAGGAGLGTDPLAVDNYPATVFGGLVTTDIGPVRLSIAATTTVFLVANDTFTLSTISAYGTLRARRAR
jgi:hypothetical protein